MRMKSPLHESKNIKQSDKQRFYPVFHNIAHKRGYSGSIDFNSLFDDDIKTIKDCIKMISNYEGWTFDDILELAHDMIANHLISLRFESKPCESGGLINHIHWTLDNPHDWKGSGTIHSSYYYEGPSWEIKSKFSKKKFDRIQLDTTLDYSWNGNYLTDNDTTIYFSSMRHVNIEGDDGEGRLYFDITAYTINRTKPLHIEFEMDAWQLILISDIFNRIYSMLSR